MRATLLAVVALSAACATLGADGVGDKDLPTSGVGPFRKLERDEVRGTAPYVLSDRAARYREPAAIAIDGGVALFVVAKDAISRVDGQDPRTLEGGVQTVLSADAVWEGGALSGPSVLRRNGTVFLYYSAAGGIGLARSEDGVVFRKETAPVLVRDAVAAWETTAPASPSAGVFPDGRVHLFYAAGGAIGEVVSDDGVAFRRASPEPVLAPVASLAPTGGERAPFDTAWVGDPCVLVRTTTAGRLHVRVLYAGRTPDGASAIGLAARYGDRGPLVRQEAPVLAVDRHEGGPALLEDGPRTFLYVHMDRTEANQTYPAIGLAIAPATVRLPPL